MGKTPTTIGEYELESRLGAGGMGAVYRARHPRFPGQTFALKVLLTDDPPTPEARARFEREMQALRAASTHPNVVRIYGGSVAGDRPFYVMELVKGESLARVADGGTVDPRRAVALVRQVADAIAHVHQHGILHRDLKPENVLVEPGDRARVCDFGLAKVADAERLTRSGTVIGTPAYSAPEQIDGRGHVADARADVYGLGAVLFHALTGRPPFVARSAPELLKKVLVDAPERPSRLRRGLPVELDAICLCALEKEAVARYPSVVDFRADLDRWLAGEPVSVQVPTFAKQVARAARQRRRELGLGALALLVVALAAGYYLWTVRVRGEVEEDARRAAVAPLTSATTLAFQLDRLKRVGGSPEVVRLVQAALAARNLEASCAAVRDAARKIVVTRSTEQARALDELGRLLDGVAGADVTEPLDLLGERPGRPAGELLLEAREVVLDALDPCPELRPALRAIADRILEAVARIARQRLALRADDGAAHALAAYGHLAAVGAPREPLGGGSLAHPRALEAIPDLEAAARELPGALGARPAWLVVDLLACAALATAATAALDSARPFARDCPASGSIERLLARPADATTYAELAADVERASPAAVERAAALLQRFLARCGAPDLIEHPELAAVEPRDLGEAVLRILGREAAGTFGPLPPRPYPAPVLLAAGGALAMVTSRIAAFDAGSRSKDFTKEGGARFEKVVEDYARARDALDELLVPALALAGEHHAALSAASRMTRSRQTVLPFSILVARGSLNDVDEVVFNFNPSDRGVSRAGFGGKICPIELEPPKDFPPSGRIRWFDERLAEEARDDAVVAAAIAGGLPREVWDRAVTAARCLTRLAALLDRETAFDGDRPALVLETLRQAQALVDLGGPSVPLFRSRIRAFLPKPLGRALSVLDARRVVRVAGAPARDGGVGRERTNYALVGAALAAEDGQRDVAATLVRLGIFWARERVIFKSSQPPTDAEIEEARRSGKELARMTGKELAEWAQQELYDDLGAFARPHFRSLTEGAHPLLDPQARDRRLGPDDVSRLGRGSDIRRATLDALLLEK